MSIKNLIPVSLLLVLWMFVLPSPVPAQQDTTDQRPESDIELLTKAKADIEELRKGSLRPVLFAARAEKRLKEILKRSPQSPLREQVMADLKPVQEILGEHNREIAQFYWQDHRYKAAESRLLQIAREYRSYSKMGEVLFRLGQIARNTDRPEDEARYLGILVCEHPTSDYFAFGIDRLNEMNIGWKGCGKDKP